MRHQLPTVYPASRLRATLLLLGALAAFAGCRDTAPITGAAGTGAPADGLPVLRPAGGSIPRAVAGGTLPPVPREWAPAAARATANAAPGAVDTTAGAHANAVAFVRHVLLENTSTGDRAVWAIGTAGVITQAVGLGNVPVEWHMAGMGDFNGDGLEDILWENTSDGSRVIWFLNGGAGVFAWVSLGVVPTQWRIAGAGDFSGDGQDDILWENSVTGDRVVWIMSGSQVQQAVTIGVLDPLWHMIAANDLSADGKDDILLENTATGVRVLWAMSDLHVSTALNMGTLAAGTWHIAGAGDVDGDGHDDILWENSVTGARVAWLLNGAAGVVSAATLTVEVPAWHITGILVPRRNTTGIRVNISSPLGASRYIVAIDGGGLPAQVGFRFNQGSALTAQISIPFAPGSGYRVRVLGTDPLDAAGIVVAVGTRVSGVNVVAGALTDVSAVLAPLTAAIVVPSSSPVGLAIPGDVTFTDPSEVFTAPVTSTPPNSYCAALLWATAPFANGGGTQTNLCARTLLTSTTARFTGTGFVPLSAGTVSLQARANADLTIDGATNVLYFYAPSTQRSEALRTVSIVPVATVTVAPPTPTVAVGSTQQMTATARDPSSAVITGLPVSWSSSNTGVATVTTAGLVSGLAAGSATIQATIGGVSGTADVTVAGGVVVGSITVGLGSSSLSGNATTLATPTVRDPSNNVIAATVAWSSTNRQVARVAADGSVQALGTGTTSITASLGGVSGSALLTVTATPGQFAITLRNVTTLTPAQQTAFTSAATRWAQVIRGDVPDVTLSNLDVSPCGLPPGTILNETVDDVLIYVTVAPIDGNGGILGSAGPCYIRAGGGPTIIGTMTFDSADMANMEANGTLGSVVLHEMGHVLGIGTLWSTQGLLQDPAPSSPDPAGDPIFTGVNGGWGFESLNISPAYAGRTVPVENCCAAGTRNGHWRESVLQRELMTGFVSAAGQPNPLSPLTAASLIDQGYVVDVSQADAQPWYIMAGPPGPQIELRELVTPPPIELNAQGRPAGARRAGPALIQGPAPKAPPRRKLPQH